MKGTMKLIVSAFLGSTITLGAIWYTESHDSKEKITIEHINRAPVTGVSYNGLPGFDFSSVAADVMPAVVHIKSTVSRGGIRYNGYQYQQLPDPFRDFFNDEFYERFFGPGQKQRPQPGDLNEREYKMEQTGSGVIINENGYIVTNNHVIEGAEEIEVTLYDKETFPATVIGTDPTTDLALIQIKSKGLHSIPLINSDDVKVGEWVLAVGNPFNLNSTVTAGIVSAKARNINILHDRYAIESFIQTDAAINPGNSGGALVNLDGGLVGINTAIASNTGSYAGYGFAVPSNMVSKIVDDLLKYGSVQRGFLGVTIREVNGKLADEKGLKMVRGVYVDSVGVESAAKVAGILPGDVIVAVNDIETNSTPQLQELIARYRPGDEVSIKVDRKGTLKNFMVTLKNRDGEEVISRKEYNSTLMSLGADFEDLDSETATKLNIEGGVRVKKLYPGILKRDTKILEGFIITKVDKEPVTSVKELTKAIENKKGGLLIEGIYESRPGTHYFALGMDM